MAKKRKSRSTSGVGHSAIRRIAEPVNPFERQRNRYTPKYLTLAIMGGAAFFLLKGTVTAAIVTTTAMGRFTPR